MFGLFFERLNSRFKKPDDKLKEDASISTVQPTRETFSPYNYSNLTSISPTMNTNQPQSYLHPSHQASTLQGSNNARNVYIDQRRMKNPSPIHSKRLDDDKGFLNATYSAGSTRSDNLRQTGNFGPNLQDKDSFMQNTGSILESTKEGSFLAQNIPTSKLVTASKYNMADDTKNSQTLQLANKLARENQDVRAHIRRDAEDVLNEKENSQIINVRKAWQDWWGEKKKNNCLLLEASKLGNIEVCRRLLDKNKGDLRGDVNCRGDNGWTPFHFACLNGNIDLVNLFLYNEADIDTETTLKYTPLHIAAQKGFAEITQLLINSGADFNGKDIFNNTPLHYAAQSGQKDIVRIFLGRPSMDLNIKNNDNKLAYDLAEEREIKKLFETFMTEKNLLNSKCTQKVTIHSIKSENLRKIFEAPNNTQSSNGEKQAIKGAANSKSRSKRAGEPEAEEKKVFSYRSNTGETKANSSLNSSGSENANNANVSAEEEKIGPHSFKVHGLIGKGSFGEVYLVEKKNSVTYYAMKVLHKSKINKHNLINYARTERNVLGLTNHPFIVKLNFAFQSPEKLFLILDYCPGGDLGEHLQRQKKFSEEKARFYLAEVILALEDLHKRDIIFRDLKPDNIVIDAEGHAKLTDFGLSKEGVLEHAQGARSFCGSVAYLAPEMLKRTGHGKAVDWYLLGVVLYEMLVGIPPYYTNNREQLFRNIEKAPLKVPSNLSDEAKSLLKGLLQRNPAKRLGSGKGDAEEIKAHEFFIGIDWKDVEQKKLNPPALERKVKTVSKVTYDIFELDPMVSENEGKVTGWSFVAAQEQDQTLDKRFL